MLAYIVGPHLTEMLAHGHALLLQTVPPNFPYGLTPDQEFQIAQEALRRRPAIQDAVVPIVFCAMIVLVVFLALRRKEALAREQAEVRKRLLDKFASGQELAAFLETRGGQQFLAELSASPKSRWMSPTGGIVCSMLGLGFIGLTIGLRGTPHYRSEDLVIPGVLLLATGLGLLISAAVSHKLASRNTGAGMSSLPGA